MSITYLITYYVGTHKHTCKFKSTSITSALSTFSITFDVPIYNIVSISLYLDV